MRQLCFAVMLLLFGACERLPGRPNIDARYVRPSEVRDFATLYDGNCAGCHGDDRRPGAAVALSDPVYLAFADDTDIRRATADGVTATAMPGFARSAGGDLTDEQIDILVRGVRSRWAKPDAVAGTSIPAYAHQGGSVERGSAAYSTYCAGCHGSDGRGGEEGGAVIDGSYLALVSDQALRTAVVVGRPRLGMPDWRGYVAGRPMSADDVADVVAWLAAQRLRFAGQPYPSTSGAKP